MRPITVVLFARPQAAYSTGYRASICHLLSGHIERRARLVLLLALPYVPLLAALARAETELHLAALLPCFCLWSPRGWIPQETVREPAPSCLAKKT